MSKESAGLKQEVLLFDGVCNLCNGAVNFIIDRDPKAKFKFAALQSEFGQAELTKLGYNTESFDSLVLLSNGDVFTKSTAALKIAKKLTGLWPLFSVFLILPAFTRDWAYNLIAKNRYNWWGKRDACRIPTPELKQRFMEA